MPIDLLVISQAVWLAIGHKAHPPKLAWPQMQ